MRASRLLVAMAIIGLMTAVLTDTAGARPPDNEFTGEWSGYDYSPPDGDGSRVMLTVGPGPAPLVVLYDEGATICGGTPLESGTFTGRGRYNSVQATLTVNFTRNICGEWTSLGPITGIVYQLEKDVLQGGGATLTRDEGD